MFDTSCSFLLIKCFITTFLYSYWLFIFPRMPFRVPQRGDMELLVYMTAGGSVTGLQGLLKICLFYTAHLFRQWNMLKYIYVYNVTDLWATWSRTWRSWGRVDLHPDFCRWRHRWPGSPSWWPSRNLLLRSRNMTVFRLEDYFILFIWFTESLLYSFCWLTSEQSHVGLTRLKRTASLTHHLLPDLLQRRHLTDTGHIFTTIRPENKTH